MRAAVSMRRLAGPSDRRRGPPVAGDFQPVRAS